MGWYWRRATLTPNRWTTVTGWLTGCWRLTERLKATVNDWVRHWTTETPTHWDWVMPRQRVMARGMIALHLPVCAAVL
jgi:hypothetical protein